MVLNELVKSHASAAGLGDARAGSLGELESGDLEALGEIKKTLVVSDSGDNNGGLGLELVLYVMLDELGQRQGRSVDARRDESPQNDSPDLRVSSPGHEAEELDEEVHVQVSRASVLLVRVSNSTAFDEINTHVV